MQKIWPHCFMLLLIFFFKETCSKFLFYFFLNFVLVFIVMDGSLALFFFDLAIFESLFQGKYLGQILT